MEAVGASLDDFDLSTSTAGSMTNSGSIRFYADPFLAAGAYRLPQLRGHGRTRACNAGDAGDRRADDAPPSRTMLPAHALHLTESRKPTMYPTAFAAVTRLVLPPRAMPAPLGFAPLSTPGKPQKTHPYSTAPSGVTMCQM